jgi:sporulation protein YlmC with PRC-barrel domain
MQTRCLTILAGLLIGLTGAGWWSADAAEREVKRTETKTKTTNTRDNAATDRSTTRRTDTTDDTTNDVAADDRDARFDEKVDDSVLRLSELKGMTVRNSEGKDLGEVDDLMLDMGKRGRVRYAALSFGGFLGMGDKLFAVPWAALKMRHDQDDDESFVMFNVNEKDLKNSPGFDKNQWPDTADAKWSAMIDKHYAAHRNAGHEAADRDQEGDESQAQHNVPDRNYRLHRASEVLGWTVRDGGGDKLGKVEDIVVARKSGDIRYVAMSFGGFLGIGDKFFAIPWNAARAQYDADDDDYYVMFDANEKQLKNAEGFDKDHWPNMGDRAWAARNDAHFGTGSAAKAPKRTRVK